GDSGGPTVGNSSGQQVGVHSQEAVMPGAARCSAASIASIDVRVDPYINVVRDAAAWRNRNPLPGRGGGGLRGGGMLVGAVGTAPIDADPPDRADDPWLDVPPDLDDPDVDGAIDVSGQSLLPDVVEMEPGPSCSRIEESCQDGLDNDEDGLTD